MLRTVKLNSMAGEIRFAEDIQSIRDECKACIDDLGEQPIVYKCWIKACAKVALAEEAEEVFNLLISKNLQTPGIKVYGKVAEAYAKKGDPDGVIRWIGKMQENGFKHNRITQNLLLLAYAQAGDFETAESILDSMRRGVGGGGEGIQIKGEESGGSGGDVVVQQESSGDHLEFLPDYVAITSLLHAYSQADQPKKAYQLFRRMQRDRMHVDLYAWHSVMDAWVRAGELAKAESIFEELKRLARNSNSNDLMPNERTYSIIIKGCKQAKADRYWEEMRRQNIEPDEYVLQAISSVYVDTIKQPDLIIAKLKSLEESLMKGNNRSAAEYPGLWKNYLRAYCGIQQPQIAIQYLEKIKKSNRVSRTDYNNIISSFCRLDNMLVVAVIARDDRYTYSSLLNGYAMVGDVKKAIETFEKMEEAGTILPSGSSERDRSYYDRAYTLIAKAAIVAGDFKCAEEWMDKGSRDNDNMYGTIINTCITANHYEKAEEVFEKMRSCIPGLRARHYAIFISGLGKRGDACKAERWMEKSIDELKHLPSSELEINFGLILKYCSPDRLEFWLDRVRSVNLTPNLIMYSTVMERNKDFSRVWEIFKQIKQDHRRFVRNKIDVYTWLLKAIVTLSNDSRDLFTSCLKEMERLGMNPRGHTATRELIKEHRRLLELKESNKEETGEADDKL
eukprot:jgi/Bigna1/82393/fgenesh1_pg.92_\